MYQIQIRQNPRPRHRLRPHIVRGLPQQQKLQDQIIKKKNKTKKNKQSQLHPNPKLVPAQSQAQDLLQQDQDDQGLFRRNTG
mmetsp:Transcript_21562/g.46891  ORF Transcript_21562/g.46891 Transcript_21562/m.46891 type:complete len:82 (-) Transcript_21562:346-591(-)